ncbi:ribonuclease T2 [Bradyrhizobium sp. SZCCHNRI3043]|uniref:ribonuclease T2 n=1 Tax=Bradyrhizobium sp. SZCCHNRI3043 TaxID=3057292 RepID=UPI0028E98C29|nr:ribonuclease T2 [Bradyrhizobium sp. SZCCHNRI3043]
MFDCLRRPAVLLSITIACFALLVGVLAAGSAEAQDRRQNAPGAFDFYVLSLSWSPSYCAEADERGGRGSRSQQCGGRPYSFVVHGLWPQYENGYPEYCEQPAPRLPRNIMTSMLDLMPAPGLIYNEWDKHGTCAGLSAKAYFEIIRKARAAIKIPPEFLDLTEAKTVAPGAVEEAFIKANPKLTTSGIAVTCNRTRLSEVRICLSKDLEFRNCDEIDRQACRRDEVNMPPVRSG